jgi:cytochrome c553
VYQAAGYLPNGEVVSKRRQMIEGLAEHLSDEDYQDLLEYIEFRQSKSKTR